jgi:hypothetical protein
MTNILIRDAEVVDLQMKNKISTLPNLVGLFVA